MSLYRKIKAKLTPGKNNIRFDDNATTSDQLIVGSEFAYSDRIVHGSLIDSDVITYRAGYSEFAYSDHIVHGSVIYSDVATRAAGFLGSDDGRKMTFHQNSSYDWTREIDTDEDEPPPSLNQVDGRRSPLILDDANVSRMASQELSELASNFFLHPKDERNVDRVCNLGEEDLEDLAKQIRHLARAHAITILGRDIMSPLGTKETSPFYRALYATESLHLVARTNRILPILGDILGKELRYKLKQIVEAGGMPNSQYDQVFHD